MGSQSIKREFARFLPAVNPLKSLVCPNLGLCVFALFVAKLVAEIRMKLLFIFMMMFVAAGVVSADEKPVPTMPETVTLTSGRVLRKVSVVRWEKDRVVLKYSGGVDPIAFSLIKSLSREDLEAIRAETRKSEDRARALQANPAVATIEAMTQYRGRVFVVGQGTGNYKMSGVTVYILPDDTWPAIEAQSTQISLPAPLAKQVSDADGRFEFAIPKGLPFVLLAQGRRLAGSREEKYEWRIRSADMKQLPTILLANDTLASDQRNYRFEGE